MMPSQKSTARACKIVAQGLCMHYKDHPGLTYGELAGVKQLLLALAENLTREPIDFMLCGGGWFCVNGVLVPYRGRGLMLAWMVLTQHRFRTAPLRAEWVFQGTAWRGSAKQAMDHAAEAVKQISPELAQVIGNIGLKGGCLVLKDSSGARVRCSLDDTLAEGFRNFQGDLPAAA